MTACDGFFVRNFYFITWQTKQELQIYPVVLKSFIELFQED